MLSVVLGLALLTFLPAVAHPGSGNSVGKKPPKDTTTTTSSSSSSSTSTSTTSTSTSTSTTQPTSGGPGDPFQSEQWGLAKVQAPQAWARATGAGVVVAVVDTGVDKDHPEFAGSKLVSGASWYDCGKGVKTPCTSSSAWDDRNGHGTHVSGIIAAPQNGIGVVGVAKDAQIMPVRALDADGSGTSDDVAAGIHWAVDHGADVVNLSLAGLPVVSQLFDATGIDATFSEAVHYAIAHNVLVVVAAGNEGVPICDNDSLVADNALCVGATDNRDLKAHYSNFGGGLDVVAPGGVGSPFCDLTSEDILSTWALDTDTVCTDRIGYDSVAGTSMAAPHVTGVAALLAEVGIRGAAAAQRISDTADDLGTPGYDPVYGYGRVNAARAVGAA